MGLSPKIPLRQNQLIPMTLNNKILDTWHYKGIQHLEDCFDKGLLMSFQSEWESDLNITSDEQLWVDKCQNSQSATINAWCRLIHNNFLHQLYLTPEKLHRFKSDQPEMCFRCDVEVCFFLHCTWLCTKVRPFWHDFCYTLTRITGITVPWDPELCLLGVFPSIRGSLTNSQLKFMEIALCVASRPHIMQCGQYIETWKSDSALLIARWTSEMSSCIPLEKISYCLRKQYDTFLKIWQPYLDHVDTSLMPT